MRSDFSFNFVLCLVFCFIIILLGKCRVFSERVLCTIAVTLLYGEYSTLDVFLPNGVFLPYGHGLDFDISFLCENSINQSINQSLSLRQRRERRTPEGR